MSAGIPVAFYAPLKDPDHPSPSGDRAMARLFLRALRAAGFAPEIASRLRSYEGSGDGSRQREIRDLALAEAERFVDRKRGQSPRLWFTYHLYYKAPDWIGPVVADRLEVPYVVAEGSRASKRAGGPWDLGHRAAERALDRADAIFALTDSDREALERGRPAHQAIVDCPPFLDLAAWPEPPRRPSHPDGVCRLLAVAMMRRGDKLASYRILAQALARLPDAAWILDIVGDGEAEGEVRSLFAPLGPRVRFHGRIEDPTRLAACYHGADLLVWPAVNEAYGMVLLEAQALGCPVIAGRCGGVASVVRDGDTGRLVPPGDAAAFAQELGALIADAPLRARLSAGARRFVRRERSLEGAAARLEATLMPLLEREVAR